MASSDNALGRSLSKVFQKTRRTEQPRGSVEVDIELIRASDGNPRQDFDQEALDELARSIGQHGLLQPIVVMERDGGYEILAGERRWRAARQQGLGKIPVVVKTAVTAQELAELRLIENVQREDLNAIELAEAYQALIDDFGLTQEQIADRVGKSRSAVANILRLLQLPERTRRLVRDGALSMGHARCLVGLPEQRIDELADRAQGGGLSVRELEAQAKKPAPASPLGTAGAKPARPGHIRELEEALARLLDAKVQVKERRRGGRLSIDFHSREHFDAVVRQLEQAFEAARHADTDGTEAG